MIPFPLDKTAARHLDVDWSDHQWTPRIVVGPAAPAAGAWFACPRGGSLHEPRLDFHRRYPNSVPLKSMIQIPSRFGRARRGFTLIEMLVVIAIIGVLAGLLLPVFSRAKYKVKVTNCRSDMKNMITSISSYDTTYSRYPANVNGQDYTYGYPYGGVNSITTNSDLMVILTALDTGTTGINPHNAKNPQRQSFYEPKTSADTNSPGLSTVDNQLRDYFGHPYVISIDYDGDGYTKDVLYSTPTLNGNPGMGGKGPNGLVDYGNTNVFLLHGPIMIWSLGLDGKADPNAGPNASFNTDNILSWQ